VLVEFADHLVLIEAPQNEVRTGAVLAKVKELKPDKPLKYVVNTHHHFDHSGGVRRAMAEEGVTIITHEGNKAFTRK
jgi:glyoxylase-like metal-dependent hydrolase (beta-lactamase superfamily II)